MSSRMLNIFGKTYFNLCNLLQNKTTIYIYPDICRLLRVIKVKRFRISQAKGLQQMEHIIGGATFY